MGRKNNRLSHKEMSKDAIKRILADNKPAQHDCQPATTAGMMAAALVINDTAPPSVAEQRYQAARTACDRILAELEQELRSDHHVRSR